MSFAGSLIAPVAFHEPNANDKDLAKVRNQRALQVLERVNDKLTGKDFLVRGILISSF